MKPITTLAAVLLLFVGCKSGCRSEPKPHPNAVQMRSASAALTGAQIAWLNEPNPATRGALETAVVAYRKVGLVGAPATPSDQAAVDGWFDQVKAAHVAADAARTRDEKERSVDLLRALAKEQAPETMAKPDAALLRHDLYGRCARMAFELDRFEDAAVVANQGLFISAPDALRVQLMILLGEARRASGDAHGGDVALDLARKALGLTPKPPP